MHEFSIVQSIVDIALESAAINHIESISVVEVEIGKVSGVVPEAMGFAWEAAVKDTLLQRATLRIREVPLLVQCRVCKSRYHPQEIYEPCPGCGEISPDIISGKELRVVAIEV